MRWEEYKKKLFEKNLSAAEIDLLAGVFSYAEEAHFGEKRKSGDDYIVHPVAVSLKLLSLNMDTPTLAAGLLHDTAEEHPEALGYIKKHFGEEIAFLVDAVTKVAKVRSGGADRALESLRKMFLAVAKDIRVVIVKLADRTHNMETLQYLPQEKRRRIAWETLHLYAPLAERLGLWDIKASLEDLSMKYLWPKEYSIIAEEVKKRLPERERILRKIALALESELMKEGLATFSLSYRAKHLYSTWKKLERYGGDWSRVADLVAIRIIVPDLKDCYGALGVIHKLFKPLPGKFKDYIALPKANGYQSLHTSVFTEDGTIIESQIRTEEMHREAEAGIAAHWAYSERGKPKEGVKAIGKKFNWIRQLTNWQKEFIKTDISSEELLESLKIDFFKDRIFVLTPKGDVIDLPQGATPLDFAYSIHSEVGNHASGAKVNGKLVSFSHELRSGETVEIVTQRSRRPSPEWFGLVHTSIAKSRIRRFLKTSPNKDSFLHPFVQKPVEVLVYGKNRVGFIKDITSTFARLHINIQGLRAERFGDEESPIKIVFFPKTKGEQEKLANRLKKVEGVVKVVLRVKF